MQEHYQHEKEERKREQKEYAAAMDQLRRTAATAVEERAAMQEQLRAHGINIALSSRSHYATQ